MTNTSPETPPLNLPTTQPCDLLIYAYQKSGYVVITEAGPTVDNAETAYVTVREKTKRKNGTIGPITRFVIEKSTGNIVGSQAL